MTKTIWTGVCTAIVGLATAAIAAQTAPSPQTTPPQSTTSSADRKITVTGCLKEAPATSAATTATGIPGATGTAGTAGTTGAPGAPGTTATTTTADAPTFILTNAVSAPADTNGAPSTTGATTTSEATASGNKTYRLIANPTALSPHVGKKLEMTGTIEPQGGAMPTTESAAGSAASAPALRVESGKIVAASCSQ